MTKAELLLLPGKLVMFSSVLTLQRAEALAEKKEYKYWFYDKRAKRLYAKVVEKNNCTCEEPWLPIGGECCEGCGLFVEPERRVRFA